MRTNLHRITMGTVFLWGAMSFAAPPTDGDILAVVHAANHAEEGSSEIMEKKSTNPDVKAFAKMMVSAHTEVDQKLNALSADKTLKPTENTDSRKIELKAAALKKELQLLDGAKLDKTFIEKQVAMHRDVLETIDKKLIPNAKLPELKKLLATVRGSVVEHIRLAEDTLKKL